MEGGDNNAEKRMACMVMTCILIIGMVAIPVSATETSPAAGEIFLFNVLNTRATNSFNISIPANATAQANSSFSLMVGETITFKASYAPFSASVDAGFIAPDGKFYYFSVTGGSIDRTIQVSQSGKYTIQVRNNSDAEIYVTGFVNY